MGCSGRDARAGPKAKRPPAIRPAGQSPHRPRSCSGSRAGSRAGERAWGAPSPHAASRVWEERARGSSRVVDARLHARCSVARLRALCVPDHADNAGQQGVAADAGWAPTRTRRRQASVEFSDRADPDPAISAAGAKGPDRPGGDEPAVTKRDTQGYTPTLEHSLNSTLEGPGRCPPAFGGNSPPSPERTTLTIDRSKLTLEDISVEVAFMLGGVGHSLMGVRKLEMAQRDNKTSE